MNFSDDFNRADNSSSLGSPWVSLQGTFGIISNQAYLSASAGDGQCVAYVETEQNGIIEAQLSAIGSGGDAGIAFRIVDVNNFYLASYSFNTDDLFIYRRLAGDFAVLAQDTFEPLSANDVLSVVKAGNDFDFLVNGVSKLTANDANHAGTKDGIRVYGPSDSVTRFNYFTFTGSGLTLGSIARAQFLLD